MQAAEIRETAEPDIYIIIDELADLLDVCGKPALQALKRILQLGRAAHIHIIAATQHVSRKTLPTELQINFPAIVALPQRSKIESRQMIAEPGAELLTVGNCLYITPQNHDPRRAAIPYIPDSELSAAVDRWKRPEAKPVQTPTAYQITPEPTPTRTAAPRKRGILARIIKNLLYP
jgi:DNA segregation ATPase FtsK/SpoIIIE-like protein